MSKQEFGRTSTASRSEDGLGQRTAKAASDAFSGATSLAGDAASRAKQVASDTAATMTAQVKTLLDQQVGNGADMVGHVAGAVKRAAKELNQDAPQLAGLISSAADRMEGYAEGLRGQSVDQLMRAASDLTRRQPAMVFGLAALAGFLALRTLKSAPSAMHSPPIQPDGGASEGRYHGS